MYDLWKTKAVEGNSIVFLGIKKNGKLGLKITFNEDTTLCETILRI